MGTYLSRTPGSAGNRKTWTISFWLKRSKVTSSEQAIFTQRIDSSNRFSFGVSGTGEFNVYNRVGGSTYNATTSGLHRDFSAWYHVVYKMDTTQASSSNRQAIYVNGVEASLSTDTVPSQNDDTAVNSTSECMWGYWANSWGNTQNLDGYLAECYMIDGQSLTPTSFGETDSTTGIWKPKTFSGSYGTNGFRLEFKNSAALGTDTSGQGNTFSVSNADTTNQVVDTPSNVFATMNPLGIGGGTFSKGNCKYVTSGTDSTGALSTISIGTGKWYAEFKAISKTGNYYNYGVANTPTGIFSGSSGFISIIYRSDGKIFKNGNQEETGLTSLSDNDIVGMAYDGDNNRIQFSVNGSNVGSVTTISDTTVDVFFTSASNGGSTQTTEMNFGNPAFTIASGNADANGYGNFEYAVPSGYYALCTDNINTYG
jgi:hypothetical protein